jgi:glycosyltransferase involved in cell wall biosynthesis
MHPWDGPIQVGSHNLARCLARLGWEVLFLSDPITTLHCLAAPIMPRLRPRLHAAGRGLAIDAASRVTHLVPFTWPPMSGRFGATSPFILDRWVDFTQPNLMRRLIRAHFDQPDLAIVDGAISIPVIERLHPDRRVLRVFDRRAARPGVNAALLEREARFAQTADLTIVTAKTLLPEVESMGARKVLHLPNGVDAGRFMEPQGEPAILRKIPRPRIIYVGAIDVWFDVPLVQTLAEGLPRFSFVLCGPAGRNIDHLTRMSNVHYLGPVGRDDLPAYLQHSDVGIIPFDVANHRALIDGVNPIKLYEYLAAGLPVVASRWAEIEALGAPVALADTRSDWLAHLRNAVESGPPETSPSSLRTCHSPLLGISATRSARR